MLTLLDLASGERKRVEPAVRSLTELLADIANAAAQSGESEYLLAKRLDRILSSSRGEGRGIREDFMLLADLYTCGLLSDLSEQFPSLTRSEIGLCGMIVLGMDPVCIDKVFGYDHGQTVYNKRTDIRKKLHIERSASLEGYLNERAAAIRSRHDALFDELRRRS